VTTSLRAEVTHPVLLPFEEELAMQMVEWGFLSFTPLPHKVVNMSRNVVCLKG
jgi:hypothetical protein